MKQKTAVEVLKALAQDTRLAIYRLLVQAGPEGLAVGEVAGRLNLPSPTLTSHLNVLRRANLVRDTREGRSIRCRADYARMNALLGFLTENCCDGDVAACAPACTPRPKRRSSP
ncbi:MAG: transcriptional regulator [Rhodanobacter sp.]|nr:MAG: transcriptional regulator [Rhodanobacter sp.]TAM08668.1 MAG: transcriptional regulator [Rhodanobacter sp.]TAM36168.1 MAG: transcriptional regulator [Rhodanobacter sp.]